ncbi:hypothetical protein FPQ18DRAFT_342086 [Pyronema domesticum]|nr:hypothetical protein FPQ18DRAFT_342086 [Pyronema domesticum]
MATPSSFPRPPKSSPLPYSSPDAARNRTVSGSLNTLSPAQISQLKESFSLLDKDGDGILSPQDLASMLSSLGLDSSPSSINAYLSSAPSPFNLASYLTHSSQQLSLLAPMSDLLAAFEAFDENDNGCVDVEELRLALTSMGERMTDEEVDRAMKGFTKRRGLRGRDEFEYREFVGLLQGKGGDGEDTEK